VSGLPSRVRVVMVVAVALAAGACGPAAPAADPAERATAAAVPPEPSAGCREGTLEAVRGERRRLTVGDGERSYILDAPAGRADVPRPVVLAFHGFRSSAWRLRLWAGFGSLGRHEGFVAVHPEGHARQVGEVWIRIGGCGTPTSVDGCERFTGCTADVVSCEGTQGHWWPPGATGRIWRFFRAHPRA